MRTENEIKEGIEKFKEAFKRRKAAEESIRSIDKELNELMFKYKVFSPDCINPTPKNVLEMLRLELCELRQE